MEVFYPRIVSHGNSLTAEVVVFGHGTAGFFVIVADVEGGYVVLRFQQAIAIAVVGEADAVPGCAVEVIAVQDTRRA